MTPEAAVRRLAEIVASRPQFTEDDIYAEMAQAGIPDSVADRAYKFTQTAWGRILVNGMGVDWSFDYLCFNRLGEVIESGQLTKEPFFMAAMALAPKVAASPGFKQLALMSADISTLNSALHAGSKPEDLSMGPAAFFMEPATNEGMMKAQRLLTDWAN